MRTPDERLYEIATANRLLAADLLDGLSEDQWRTPSLCAGWTVREVAAHLVPPADGFKVLPVVWRMIRFRGNLNRMVDVTVRHDAQRPVESIVTELRQRASVELSAPGIGPAGPMTDTAIHLRDAARPLGLQVNPEASTWLPVLNFLVSKSAARGFVPKGRLSGLRLQVTDESWSWGKGDEIRGTAEAVALAAAGRDVVLPRTRRSWSSTPRRTTRRRMSRPTQPRRISGLRRHG